MEILGLVDIPLTLVLVVMVIVSLYVYQTWHFNTWRNLGIQGPKPRPILGNMPLSRKVDFLQEQEKWKKQYGRNYGMFMFRDPLFVTSDPEVIKEVGIKSFNNFADRYIGFDRVLDDFSRKMLAQAKGRAWRRYRHVMAPAFTIGKLKALQGYMIRCSQTLAEVLKNSATKQEDIDLKETYQRFTMDVIAGTAFGLDTNLQKGEEEDTHDMIQAMKGIMSNLNILAIHLLAVSFPFTAPVLRALGYTMFPPKDINFFKQCITAIIHQRDANPQEAKKRVDFLQQMMDLRVAPGEEVTDMEVDSGGTKTNKKLTEDEVLAQGIEVFNAGFETTSSTLRFLTYCLANHQDVQEKLYREIVQVVGQKRVDFLQQMMDLWVAPGEEVTDMEDDSGETKTNKKLTEDEVLAQGVQMFSGGFETTSSTLRFLTYCLANHQDVQEKLYREIVQVVGQGEVKYEHLQQLKYLEWVILETLRMYPIVPNASQLAERAMDIKGFHIPEGTGILLAIYTATHDPDLYPDPFTYNPDRFAEGRDSLMAALPFGVGPRQCIGMRLAMQEVKTAIIHVFRAVRFVPCDKTPKTLELDSRAFLIPKQPVIVRAEIRT